MGRNHLVRVLGLALASCVMLGVTGMAWADKINIINIATVAVGNVGNAADTTGFGAVAYEYNIGKYEVTAGQYTAFLNAVAKTDTHNLYNPAQGGADGSGITRDGTPGSYIYNVDNAFINRPVNYVSFWDATRFANWLHNGQLTGLQDASTTEDGAYTLTPSGITSNTITRNTGWTWAIASEDEWYKAAYYNPSTKGYFLYPTSSNDIPGRDLSDVSGNNGNRHTSQLPGTNPVPPIDDPYYTTVVGEFDKSDSPYGTFDQGGNVLEWNDTIVIQGPSYRGVRGGSFRNTEYYMASTTRYYDYSGTETAIYGFRVVQAPADITVVPVPGAVWMGGLGLMGMVVMRWLKRQ